MSKKEATLQECVQKFFLERMINQKNASPETIKSYRDSFKLYFTYLNDKCGIQPHKVSFSHFEAEYILGFLDYLANERRNQSKTINNRLAAVHAFLKFLSFEKPDYIATIQRSMLIPFRKEEKKQMDFLTKEEVNALMNVCDLSTELGQRDKLMLLLLYNTGIRVSELLALKCNDVVFDRTGSTAYIHVIGKGRKERNIPLWKSTTKYVKEYIDVHEKDTTDKIFVGYTGDAFTKSGIRYRINSLVYSAMAEYPSLRQKNVTPHTFRHTTALHLLQAGIDISTIAIWLGHESIMTTHKYMEADMEMKKRILEKLSDCTPEGRIYKPKDDILTFLTSL